LRRKIYNPYLRQILETMCEMVGAKLRNIDIREPDWMTRYSWKKEDAEKFKLWLFRYLKVTPGARMFFMSKPDDSDDRLMEIATQFVIMYGWEII